MEEGCLRDYLDRLCWWYRIVARAVNKGKMNKVAERGFEPLRKTKRRRGKKEGRKEEV